MSRPDRTRAYGARSPGAIGSTAPCSRSDPRGHVLLDALLEADVHELEVEALRVAEERAHVAARLVAFPEPERGHSESLEPLGFRAHVLDINASVVEAPARSRLEEGARSAGQVAPRGVGA